LDGLLRVAFVQPAFTNEPCRARLRRARHEHAEEALQAGERDAGAVGDDDDIADVGGLAVARYFQPPSSASKLAVGDGRTLRQEVRPIGASRPFGPSSSAGRQAIFC